MFKLFDSCDPLLVELQQTAKVKFNESSKVVAAKKAVVDLSHFNWAKKLLDTNGQYMELINENCRKGNLVGSKPNNYLIPYPISQWQLQINYSLPEDKSPVVPHFDTPCYVCICLVEDFPENMGGELCIKNKELLLTKAGECIVVHGSQVEHWVNNVKAPRTTLIISLLDKRDKVVIDHMNPMRMDVVKDWVNWHRNNKTKSDKEIVDTLISKL